MSPRFRLLCGSQHLYGPGPLRTVESNARAVVAALAPRLPHPLEFGALVTTPEQVEAACLEANADPSCAGVVLWMHTFSPARMWIGGLLQLRRPFLHLHTQSARDLPWATIDMDYMNLHQAAHGDREAGHLHTRLGLRRTVVAGHAEDPAVAARTGAWMRAAVGWHTLRNLRVARFGDNMRDVAVTEGDKVAAQQQFGVNVRGHGVGELAAAVAAATDAEVDALCAEYGERYVLAKDLRRGGARHASVREAARIELGLRAFLAAGGYGAFTTTFEDLHGLRQLPGVAAQRLMADGFGFGAEGDWKTAALLRAVKAMTAGMKGGTSFMEDYTYHLDPRDTLVLGAHMLEVCPSIAARKPSLEVHPLGIGGKEDPARLVFDARPGRATNASLIDLGDRFRLVVAEVEAVKPPRPLPRLPVARAVWRCLPEFATACEAWIQAGGAHHTVYSLDATTPMLEAFAEMAGIECAVIDADTDLRTFVRALRSVPTR